MNTNSNDEVVLRLIGRLTLEFKDIEDDLQKQLKIKSVIEEVLYDYEVTTKETSLVASDIEDRIQLYIACRRLENLSEKTLRNYELQLLKFASFFRKPVSTITTMDIRIYLAAVGKELKASSLNEVISILKTFFKWLAEEDYILKNPLNKIKQSKVPKRARRALNDYQVEVLREGCWTKREKALVEFLLSTGCRVAEVASVNKRDIDWSNLSLKVIGKGNKEREVSFTPKAKRLLQKYLESRVDTNEALFVGSKRPYRRLGIRAIQREIERIYKRTELDTKVSPHFCRHTFATQRLNSGMALPTLQKFMGHSSPATTQIYAEMSNENMKYEYRRSS